MLPYLSPAWVIHATCKQTALAGAAILNPQSVGVVGIERTGLGIYDITLDQPLDPSDSLLSVVTPFTAGGRFAFPVFARDTDTVRGVNVVDGVVAAADGRFDVIIFRFGTV